MSLYRVVFWAAYLACSWTWCIGMVMPVLLMRDHGWQGFWMFAAPNVLGAAAMGWVIKSRADSRRFTNRHGWAVACFSLVTILFHGVAMPWVFESLGAATWTPALLAAAVTAALAAVLPTERVPGLAMLVWIVSAVTLGWLVLGGVEPPVSTIPPARDVVNGLFLLPVSFFGFLLCPYLDATFHRTASTLPWAERAGAFTLGFGVLFFVMLLTTAAYAAPLAAAIGGGSVRLPGALATVLPIHLGAQAGLSIALHAREGRPKRFCRYRWSAMTALALLIGIGAWVLVRAVPSDLWGLSYEEIAYRVVIGAYGLACPVYAWRIARRPGVRKPLLNWALAALIASPWLTAGFLLRENVWMLPGIVAALVLPVVGQRRPASA